MLTTHEKEIFEIIILFLNIYPLKMLDYYYFFFLISYTHTWTHDLIILGGGNTSWDRIHWLDNYFSKNYHGIGLSQPCGRHIYGTHGLVRGPTRDTFSSF